MPVAKAPAIVLAIEGTCLCKAVRVGARRAPTQVTQCNCTVCRHYGTLWAYYKRTDVLIEAKRGALERWQARYKGLQFIRCKTCGCVVCWDKPASGPARRLGMNTRLFEHVAMSGVPIAVLDGDKTWRVTDKYVKPDIWMSPKRATLAKGARKRR